eukprot:6491782-Amphidinium_carterae.1
MSAAKNTVSGPTVTKFWCFVALVNCSSYRDYTELFLNQGSQLTLILVLTGLTVLFVRIGCEVVDCLGSRASKVNKRIGPAYGEKWREKHATCRRELKLDGLERYTDNHEVHGIQQARALDVINLAYAHHLSQGSSEACNLFVDVSQCGSRKPWSQGCRSITTSTELFCFAQSRVVSPAEVLCLLGFRDNMSVTG